VLIHNWPICLYRVAVSRVTLGFGQNLVGRLLAGFVSQPRVVGGIVGVANVRNRLRAREPEDCPLIGDADFNSPASTFATLTRPGGDDLPGRESLKSDEQGSEQSDVQDGRHDQSRAFASD
jgi:hypothetical protein